MLACQVLQALSGTEGLTQYLGDDADTRELEAAGPGARGIIYGAVPGDTHYINAINQNGVIRFLDGQSGGAADLSRYSVQQFVRTGL